MHALLLLLVTLGPAKASGQHVGIAISDLQALHQEEGRPPQEPAFGTSATGWSLFVPGGQVFVYVAPSAGALDAWVALQLERQRPPPEPVPTPAEGVDAAWRRGTDLALLRDGNVGILVQGTTEATEEAALVRGLIRDEGPPWPAPPQVQPEPDGTWSVLAPGAVHVAWQGGRRAEGPGPRFLAPPDRLVAWDGFGRAAVSSPAPPEPPGAPEPSPP